MKRSIPSPAEPAPGRSAGARPGVVCKLTYEQRGQTQTLTVGDRSVVIGRAPDCDLVLGHESVSRRHARFSRSRRGWRVRDLGSKNGVQINGRAIEEQFLHDGDVLDVGNIQLTVDISAPSASQRARVVFDEEREGMRTQIIDMEGLERLLATDEDGALDRAWDTSPGARSVSPEPTPNVEAGSLLQLFSQAAQALLTSVSLDDTLDKILSLVFDNLPAERGVICLVDDESGEMLPKVMRTLEGVANEPVVISSNIARDVIERKRALLVQDTLTDKRYGLADSVVMMKIQSAMCAPLYHDGRVTGFLYADRQSGKNPFTGAHLQALSTLAVLSAVAVEQAGLRDAVRREQALRARLARYSSPAVVDRIVNDTSAIERAMKAEEGVVSVLFADLVDFTPLAETLPPADVVRILNQVFERTTGAIFELEGTVDKFRGDGVMAFFGAPLAQPDHAVRAVEAALRIQECVSAFNAESAAGYRLRVHIGINSGQVVVGDIGSPQRKDYTVIGDVVNTASRLESAVAKPGQIVIGPATHEQVKHLYECEAMPVVPLKGKSHRVQPYLVKERIKQPPRSY